MKYKTEQEAFWAGEFGTNYILRNQGPTLLASNLHFFAKALGRAQGVRNCIEFGANVGMNLKALKLLYPCLDPFAVEINAEAAKQLASVIPADSVSNMSILDFNSERQWDLVLVKGVLIHIAPEALTDVYDKLFAACDRYMLIAEYYNPEPVSVRYRGHSERLFKRDFAGEILERHPTMRLLDYGFVYRRDPSFPQDDVTWFLLEKNAETMT